MAVPRRPLRFSKGIYVTPDHRRRGIARALIDTMIARASAQGCVECASDAPIDNAVSHSLHRALDFTETECVVFFRRPISAARRDDPPIP